MSDENIFDAEAMAKEYDRQQFEIIKINRLLAYQKNADPLFFKWQAGEATKEEWLDARSLVVEQNPYPESDLFPS